MLILIRCLDLWHLIWVYNICSCPTLPIRRLNLVISVLIVTVKDFQIIVGNQIEVSRNLSDQELLISDREVPAFSHARDGI